MNQYVAITDGTECELIDTLWNVNVSLFTSMPPVMNELIDTLWNVNEYPIPQL